MRLKILETGHREKAAAALEKLRQALGTEEAPDVVRVLLYRPEFFGKPCADWLQAASRGPSSWSVGERELMAAFTSKLNQCPW